MQHPDLQVLQIAFVDTFQNDGLPAQNASLDGKISAIQPVAHADLLLGHGIELLGVPVFCNRFGLFVADKRLRFHRSEQRRKLESQLRLALMAKTRLGSRREG
jgi:hypothetical protein